MPRISRELTNRIIMLAILVVPLLYVMPVSAATSVSITSPTNQSSITSSSFIVTGTATANRNITVKVNGETAGKTISDGSGDWSIDFTGQSTGAKTIGATASTQTLYVNNLNAGSQSDSVMTKIDTVTDTVSGTFSTGSGGSSFISWEPNSTFTKAYGVGGAAFGSGEIFPINLASETLTNFTMAGSGPQVNGVTFNTDQTKVYVTDIVNRLVRAYNTTTDAEIGSGIASTTSGVSITARPNSNEVWSMGDGKAAVINTITDTVTDTYNIGSGQSNVAFSPDGTLGFAAGGTTVIKVDASNGSVLDTASISAGTISGAGNINHAGTRLYVPQLQNDKVDVFDTATLSLIDTITVGTGPVSGAFTDDDSKLYIANADFFGGITGTTISVIDTSNNTVVDTITVAAAPIIPKMAPLESASDSVDVVVASTNSSDLDSLADTGQNTTALSALAVLLLTVGTISYGIVARKKQLQ